jgi:hypothetical protein
VAYRAEIEIGVRGAHQLKDLQEAVDRLGNDIDRVNKKQFFGTIQVANLRNYNNVVQQASANLQEARITLDAAGQASGRYATAINQYVTALGRSNAAQQITNDLVQKEISLREEAARVARLQASGLKEVTQYAGPIGPGPASAIDAPVRGGVSGVVASTIDPSRGVAVQRDQLTLEQALLNLQERKADKVFEELKGREALVRSANEAKLIAAEAAGQRLASDISLRSPERAKREERTTRAEQIAKEAIARGKAASDEFNQRRQNLDKIAEFAKQNEAKVFQVKAKGIRRELDLEFKRIIETTKKEVEDSNKVFQKRIEDDKKEQKRFTERLNERVTARKKADKEVADNRRKLDSRVKNAASSALIGGAFPLLFGQGVGAAAGGFAGGALGGLVGGQFGFALSLVGTQIGTAIDSFSLLGQELNSVNPDVAKISESLGIAGTETQQYIDALVASGREQEAAAFATSELAALIGNEGVNALKEFGSDTQDLANEFTRAMTVMGAAIAELVNKAGLLKGAIDEIERFNLAGQAERSTDPEIRRLLERRRTETRTGPGGSGTDIVLFENLTEQIIERQRELNRLKREGLDIDGVVSLKTKELGRSIQANLDKSLNALELSRINAGLENDKVFKLRLQGIELERNEAINQNILDLNNKQITRLQALKNQTKINADAEAARNELTNDRQNALDRLNKTGGTGGRGEGPDGEKIIKSLVRQTALQKELNTLAKETPEDKIGEIKLSQDRQLLQLQNSRLNTLDRIAEITDADLRAVAERLELELTATKEAAIRLDTDQKITEEKDRQKDAIEKNLRSIQNEIDLSKARLNGTEDEVRLKQQLQAIGESAGITDAKALEDLKTRLELLQEQLASEKAIQEVRDIQQRTATAGAGLRAGFIGQAGQAFEQQLQQGATAERATEIALLTKEMELAELQAQSLQNVVLGIGDAFATAMTTGVAELVAGTKSAEEVFSDFLKNVGNILLQTAQQMIATYIAIGIARAFAGLAGGGAPDAGDAMGGSGSLPLIANPGESVSMNAAGGLVIPGLAKGGPARAGQPYMVGERGPELFVPSSNGGVMRNEDMRQLMGRSPVGNAPAMNFTFETTNIGGQEFVSREQLEAAMLTTRRQAANDGAKRGMNMTLDRMQNSPRTRARVGIG